MRSGRLALVAAVALGVAPAPVQAARPLVTGLTASHPDARAFAEARSAGASFFRIGLDWNTVAPAQPGQGFDAADPASAGYDWSEPDAAVAGALAAGLEPILDIVSAPRWAKRDADAAPGAPKAAALAAFATAAATHYGSEGSSHVRYWEVWNEPNISLFLSPQLVGGRPVGPVVYRGMVNAFAGAVKAVDPSNLVVAGALAPFYDQTPSILAQNPDWGPLTFMRSLLCLSKTLHPTCKARVRFDIWSLHPYTSGGPGHHAFRPDDVSLGDVPDMTRTLRAAVRAGHVRSNGAIPLWVTEFSWDSNPPDPKGVPLPLLERWISHALYELWSDGVQLVTWFGARDEPLASSPFQSGLYTVSGRPKPTLRAFRFPFVAFPRDRGLFVWGRTPSSEAGRVLVQRRIGARWRTVAQLQASRSGIFQRVVAAQGRTGLVRAVAAGEHSVPFSLARVPDRPFDPFGSTTPLEGGGR